MKWLFTLIWYKINLREVTVKEVWGFIKIEMGNLTDRFPFWNILSFFQGVENMIDFNELQVTFIWHDFLYSNEM